MSGSGGIAGKERHTYFTDKDLRILDASLNDVSGRGTEIATDLQATYEIQAIAAGEPDLIPTLEECLLVVKGIRGRIQGEIRNREESRSKI